MKRKLLSIVLAVTMLCTALAGCSGASSAAPAASSGPSEASASVASSAPKKTVTLKFGNASAPDKLGSIVMAEFCKNLEEKSNGEIICEWYPAEQLGSSTAQIEAMMTDNQSGNFTSIDVYSSYVNDLGVIAVPFLFEDSQHLLDWLASDSAKTLLDRLASEANLRIINYNFQRLPRVLISTTEVKVPGDLKGKKFRVANIPLQQKMFSYWGGSTNQISFSEYPMALMQGVVNAGETSSESFSTSKFHLYAPYVAEVDFAYPLDCICMSENVFKSLTPEQQQLVYECAEIASEHYNSKVQAEWEAYRPTMVEEGAIFTEVDKEVWRQDMEGFYEQLNAEGFFEDSTLIDTIKAMRS